MDNIRSGLTGVPDREGFTPTALAALIQKRRTIHLFEDRPVSPQLLADLLDVSVWVPNHGVTEPWRFIIIHGEGRRVVAEANRKQARMWESDELKKAEKGQKAYDTFMAVPAFVIVVMEEHPQPVRREEDYAAACCLIQNFLLLAWEQGLGTVWKTYGLIHQPHYREALGVRPGEKIVGSLHVGYPAKVPALQPRTKASDRLTILDSEVAFS